MFEEKPWAREPSIEYLCAQCKRPGHYKSECTNVKSTEQYVWYHCDKPGHIRTNCPQLKDQPKREMLAEEDDEEYEYEEIEDDGSDETSLMATEEVQSNHYDNSNQIDALASESDIDEDNLHDECVSREQFMKFTDIFEIISSALSTIVSDKAKLAEENIELKATLQKLQNPSVSDPTEELQSALKQKAELEKEVMRLNVELKILKKHTLTGGPV